MYNSKTKKFSPLKITFKRQLTIKRKVVELVSKHGLERDSLRIKNGADRVGSTGPPLETQFSKERELLLSLKNKSFC